MTEQELKRALTRGLSGELPADTRRAVLTKVREKERPMMKNKLSVALILVLVLTLLSTVALAVTLSRQYFEDVARLQFESGWYEEWGLEEKLAMVGILEEYGLISEEEAQTLDDEAAIDAYMVARYGVEGSDRIDTIGIYAILETELGKMQTWSLEQKAWYTDMMIRVGLLTRNSDDALCDLPGEDDMQPEAAIALAKSAILVAYGLPDGALDAHQIDIAFETHASDWERENLHYNIHFWGDGLAYYSCSITRDGRIMDSTMDKYVLSPAELAEIDRRDAASAQAEALARPWAWEVADDGTPGAETIAREEATVIATRRLHDIGYDLPDHVVIVRYASQPEPCYIVYFIDDVNAPTEVFSVTVAAASGEVLNTVTPNRAN